MPIAFKEWAVTVRALAEGEQLIVLRAGSQSAKRSFELEHSTFFLYPTFEKQRADLVRESHRGEMDRALEEGVWTDGEPSPLEISADGSLPQPDRIRIRAWAEVAHQWAVTDRKVLNDLAPFHVWDTAYAEKRLGWRRRHPLQVIMLRTHRIPRPVTVKVSDEYGTEGHFAEISRDLPFEGTPVLSDSEFDRAAEMIGEICLASDRSVALV